MVKLLGDTSGGSHVLTIALASIFYSIIVVSVGMANPTIKSGYEVEFFTRIFIFRKDRPLARQAVNLAAANGFGAAAITATLAG